MTPAGRWSRAWPFVAVLAVVQATGASGLAVAESFVDSVCARSGAVFDHMSPHDPNDRRVIGTTSQGSPIHAEHWGPLDGPQILVIAQIHGDECSPAHVLTALRRRPPSGFGMWIVPTLNPDGLRNHRRRNPDGIDLNRDGFALKAPETRALMDFTVAVRPVLSVHVHAPSNWLGHHNGGSPGSSVGTSRRGPASS